MTVSSEVIHPDVVDYFKKLSFYNKPIEKAKIKRLKNIDLLAEQPFYKQLSIIKTNQVFRGYAMSYKVEIVEKKDLILQLEASKSSIKDHEHVLCSFTYKIVCIDDKFSKPIVVYRGENAAYEFIKAILKEYKYCKKIIKKYFNKNLIMSEEEEHLFQQSNSCSICKKLIDQDNQKVINHCHVTRKSRGVAH